MRTWGRTWLWDLGGTGGWAETQRHRGACFLKSQTSSEDLGEHRCVHVGVYLCVPMEIALGVGLSG